MNDNKILYYAFVFPFPANDGGEQVIKNHVETIKETYFGSKIKFFFSNLRKYKPYTNLEIDYQVFEVKSYNKVIKELLRFWYLCTSFYTASYHFAATAEITNAIKNLKPDVVILDGAYGNLVLQKIKNYKLIYIAHNIEYQFNFDNAKLQKNIFMKLFLLINAFKTKAIEQQTIAQANKIICISTSDFKYFKKIYPEKTILIPHKIILSKDLWKPNNSKTLFFCGALDFTPNNEAVKWIVEKLAPVLPKDIKIKIAGKGTDSVQKAWEKDNIEFLGFVSKEELINLYKTSSAFICPIIYGSGIKVKVTEALSYGMPIIGTREALEGLDYINIKPLIDRSNLKQTKENIENLLNNKEKLQKYSSDLINQIKTFQAENNYSYEEVIEEVIKL